MFVWHSCCDVWANLPLGNLLKAFDQKLHSIVRAFVWYVLFLFILSISPLYFFFYFHDLAKETYNWKMSRRVQRKALKFECDQLKKVFTKIPLTSNSTSSCNFRLAVFPCSIFHIHSKTQEKQWVRQISFTDRLICQVYNTILWRINIACIHIKLRKCETENVIPLNRLKQNKKSRYI